jgi:hypothetical protein
MQLKLLKQTQSSIRARLALSDSTSTRRRRRLVGPADSSLSSLAGLLVEEPESPSARGSQVTTGAPGSVAWGVLGLESPRPSPSAADGGCNLQKRRQ